MRTAYIAFDGRIFEDKGACEKYELNKTREDMIMYSADGRTDDFDDCLFVYIKNTDGVKRFLDFGKQEQLEMERDSSLTENIYDVGYYMWDFENLTYKKINYYDLIEAIGKFYNEKVLTEND